MEEAALKEAEDERIRMQRELEELHFDEATGQQIYRNDLEQRLS